MNHPGSSPRSEEAVLLQSDWRKQLSYPVELASYNGI